MRCAVLLAVLATFLGRGGGICVLDNKHGWNVQCGIRDSYLLRLKDYGGLKANFDFGFGLGNEEGFPESIKNTKGNHHHHRRNDDEAIRSLEEVPVGPNPPMARQAVARPVVRRTGDDEAPPRQRLRYRNRRVRPAAQARPTGPAPPTAPALLLRPPPLLRRQISGESGEGGARPRPFRRRHPQTQTSAENVHTQEIFVRPGTSPTIVFTHEPAPPPTPTPSNRPTVGPAMGDLLRLDASTPADTDHVPSFAAKMFIVREAPEEFNPPGYKAPVVFPKIDKRVEVPRTKFFCEEQKYLPGIYADVQLGCKVFHLCLPAAMGNTLTSFLCPNMTLFDQSIMQCNYWYHVNCENSHSHYDANLPMALGYRKINAAQLPLTAVRDFGNVALLSHNSQEMKNHLTITAGDPSIAENFALKRIGEVETLGAQSKMDAIEQEVPRGPRMLSTEKGGGEDFLEAEDNQKSIRSKRSAEFEDGVNMKSLNSSPLLFKLYSNEK